MLYSDSSPPLASTCFTILLIWILGSGKEVAFVLYALGKPGMVLKDSVELHSIEPSRTTHSNPINIHVLFCISFSTCPFFLLGMVLNDEQTLDYAGSSSSFVTSCYQKYPSQATWESFQLTLNSEKPASVSCIHFETAETAQQSCRNRASPTMYKSVWFLLGAGPGLKSHYVTLTSQCHK